MFFISHSSVPMEAYDYSSIPYGFSGKMSAILNHVFNSMLRGLPANNHVTNHSRDQRLIICANVQSYTFAIKEKATKNDR